MARPRKNDVVVNKTVSMPLSLLSEIAAEADVMGKGFSETMATLVRFGLNVRRRTEESLRRDADAAQKELKI